MSLRRLTSRSVAVITLGAAACGGDSPGPGITLPTV